MKLMISNEIFGAVFLFFQIPGQKCSTQFSFCMNFIPAVAICPSTEKFCDRHSLKSSGHMLAPAASSGGIFFWSQARERVRENSWRDAIPARDWFTPESSEVPRERRGPMAGRRPRRHDSRQLTQTARNENSTLARLHVAPSLQRWNNTRPAAPETWTDFSAPGLDFGDILVRQSRARVSRNGN